MVAELATTLTVSDADLLLEAESQVRGYCGWHIAPSRTETVTLTVAPYGSILMLPSLHVTAIVGVSENAVDLVTPDDFTWSENGVLTRYWWAAAPLEVEFTHGYATVPSDVRGVVRNIAIRAKASGGTGLKSQTIGPFSETYGTDFPDEKAVLDRYRIPPRP